MDQNAQIITRELPENCVKLMIKAVFLMHFYFLIIAHTIIFYLITALGFL